MNNFIEIRQLSRKFLEDNINFFRDMLKDIPNEYWNEKNFLADLPRKWDFSIYVRNLDEKIIGYIIASEKGDTIHIHKFIVDKDFRNQNIGKNLLNYLINLSKKSNKNYITLKVHKENLRAFLFYKRENFKVILESENLYTMKLEI